MTIWRVERATVADAEILSTLEKEAFGDKAWGEGAVAAGIDAPFVTTFLVYGSDVLEPAGFAVWRLIADVAEILTFGVSPQRRRKGAAQFLLAIVIENATEGGANALFLDVDQSNDAAVNLYEKAGFQHTGRRSSYYRNGGDALVMRLGLA